MNLDWRIHMERRNGDIPDISHFVSHAAAIYGTIRRLNLSHTYLN
jgi:hypothetical protein